MEVVYQETDKLIPYANNPRKNDEAVDAVAASIDEFGFRVPIIVDDENIIIAGHTRLKAAKQLGLETVPTIKVDGLTEEQIKAFRIADNKTAEIAEWDFEMLETELEGLEDLFTGFDLSDIMESEDYLNINYEGHDSVKKDRVLKFAHKKIHITEEEESELLRVYDEYVKKHGVDIGFVKGLVNGLETCGY